MKILLQRVKKGSVTIAGKVVGEIGEGIVLLVGFHDSDTEKDLKFLAEKAVNLRIHNDENGKMNLSTLALKKDILIVSQFTLYGDTRKGRRPSFIESAKPDYAEKLYEEFISEMRKFGLKVGTGEFGADMLVEIQNDGPVTLMLES
ncbi:MAG: D-tyrosyl-tRNA(Tyr) deacylase [Calditrichaeota bacterium]|nr:MAG: D-tyrosyl-tRNA(Tyr) deacylase [Calditrichota bacterium]